MNPLRRFRDWLTPETRGYGWTPLANLGYLVFLFVPLMVRVVPSTWVGQPIPFHLGGTLASIVVFMPLYAMVWRGRAKVQLSGVVGMLLVACALFPLNPYSNTYVIYAASMAAFIAYPVRVRLGVMLTSLLAFLGWMLLLRVPSHWVLFVGSITSLIGVAVFFANHFQAEREKKQADLKLSHEEVRRLASMAERERIGRDLHDLLGHTLSMIAMKAELAGRLLPRDPSAAQREIDDVARISRQTLGEVRTAVSGIRSAAIAAELASARLLLETEGIACDVDIADLPLGVPAESALALSLREAATNIQRHASARVVQVSLQRRDGDAVLQVRDDGRGVRSRPGNGLTGMRERLEAVGGRLRIESAPGAGTCIEAAVPLMALPA